MKNKIKDQKSKIKNAIQKSKVITFYLLLVLLTFYFYLLTSPVHAQAPAPTSCGTTHENAICKTNILEPEELTEDIKVEEPDILRQLLNNVINWARALGFPISKPENYYPRSELQNQSEVPEEVMPSGDPEDRLPGFLGDEGVWGVTLPEFESEPENTEGFEAAYEDAYFPENIDKITKP